MSIFLELHEAWSNCPHHSWNKNIWNVLVDMSNRTLDLWVHRWCAKILCALKQDKTFNVFTNILTLFYKYYFECYCASGSAYLLFMPTLALVNWVGDYQNLLTPKQVILQESQSKALDIIGFGCNLSFYHYVFTAYL